MKDVLAKLGVTAFFALPAAATSIPRQHAQGKAKLTRSLRVGFILLAVVLGGCTTTTVTPEFVRTPVERYQVVAVGDLTSEDKLWDYLLPHFRRAFVQRIQEDKTFTTALDPAPDVLLQSSILLTGKITEVDKGSKAWRAIVGFGAGRARVRGLFQIRDAKGVVLAKFESKKAYSGGAGIGGFDLLDMEDLMARFGKDTADSVIKWSKGEGIR